MSEEVKIITDSEAPANETAAAKSAEGASNGTANNAETATANESAIISPEDLASIKAEAAKASENWDKFMRKAAEFENFRKVAERRRQDDVLSAKIGMVRSLLPVIDNFDMAMAAAEALKDPSAQSLKMGIDMVRNQLRGVLTEYGVEEVDAVGKTFDPNLHEAVSQMESTEVAEGNVLQQLRKGYRMRERLIRPASVIVAKSPAQPAQQ